MRSTISHEFVDVIPDRLEDGVVYVCIPYATVVHRCCCGCGYEVVTPLHPTRWSLVFDGESISLAPSIGNWSFPCRSHYWIRKGRVHPARSFTADEIARLRAEESAVLAERYEAQVGVTSDQMIKPTCREWTVPIRWIRRLFR